MNFESSFSLWEKVRMREFLFNDKKMIYESSLCKLKLIFYEFTVLNFRLFMIGSGY